jgi:hypothetical protein
VLGDAVLHLLDRQQTRPLGIGVTIGVVFLPATLIMFLARPDLFQILPLATLLVLAAAISLPIVMLCFGIWYSLLRGILDTQRVLARLPEDTDFHSALQREEALEWPCLFAGSWSAAIVLFGTASLAYYRPIRVGSTFIAIAIGLIIVWLFAAFLGVKLVSKAKRVVVDGREA